MAQAAANRGPLVGAVALLVLLAILPTRWSGWTSSLAGVVKLAVAPVSSPLYQTTRWAMRDDQTRDTPQVERDRDHFKWLWQQDEREVERLTRTIEQLQKGRMVSELPVMQLVRPVVGTSSDGRGGILDVRAGSSQGVAINDVATTDGVQLIGKVVAVNAKTCTVRLLTHAGAGGINGIVMTDDDKPGAICSLFPYKGTLLQGQVGNDPKSPKPAPVAGQTVRLEDSQWPKHAQRLVLGVITDVKTITTGRQLVEVKPTVDLDRLSEVVLRLTPKDADDKLAAPTTTGKSSTDGRP